MQVETLTPPSKSILRGIRVQASVIGALVMRELHTRYGRDNVGYIWLILEPMLLAVAIAMIHARAGTHFGPDIKPVPMAVIGYCNFMTLRSIISRAESAVESNVGLLYHRTVSVFDILISRALLDAAGTLLSMLIIMAFLVAVEIANLPARPLIFMAGVVAMFMLSFGLAMLVSAFTHDNRTAGRFVHPITYLMMPLSGVFFTMAAVPSAFRGYLYYVPFVHIFEILRYGWFRTAKYEFIDLNYLATWIMATNFMGMVLISRLRSKIHLH